VVAPAEAHKVINKHKAKTERIAFAPTDQVDFVLRTSFICKTAPPLAH
jgi:hypothetical protein